jgi:aromatic ring-opening dioxygenase catalytic subunit (LigB family)
MSLVFAGICSHAPGITGRRDMADPAARQQLYDAFDGMRAQMEAARPDAVVIIAAEHFANFFMDNMPSFAMGMADQYQGPIEDPGWLKINRTTIPGSAALSRRLVTEVMQSVDIAYCEEWKFDHGIMVPLHFLTPAFQTTVVPVNINCQGPPLAPLSRVWALGEALGHAARSVPERIAIIGTGGISHWPATPDSGKINESWDREFLRRWCANDQDALLSYNDSDTYQEAGQGGFEIRTLLAVSAAVDKAKGSIQCYVPIPIFAVGCTIGTYAL